MDTVDVAQPTRSQTLTVANGLMVCARGLWRLSMASGVLLLVLRWGDLTGFLTR
jgi:hypothetical protein